MKCDSQVHPKEKSSWINDHDDDRLTHGIIVMMIFLEFIFIYSSILFDGRQDIFVILDHVGLLHCTDSFLAI